MSEVNKLLAKLGVELGKYGVDVAQKLHSEQWANYLQRLWDQGTIYGTATGIFEEFQIKYYIQKLAEEVSRGDRVQKALDLIGKVLEQAGKCL